MKRRIMFLVVLLLTVVFVRQVKATDCYDFSGDDYILPKALIEGYQNYGSSVDNINYSLCFKNSEPFVQNEPVTINVTDGKKLTITDLKLTTTNSASPLLTLSGTNITLDGISLKSNGGGTAIQVKGSSIVIQNSTISNFTKGIEVMEGGSAKLTKNTYEIADWKNAILQGTDWIAKDETDAAKYKIGKHINDDDKTKVDYVVAEVANTVTCDTGSVEMYFGDPSKINNFKPLESTVCQQPTAAHDDYSVDINNDEKEDFKIANGKCAFRCEFPKQDLTIKALFTYTTADNKTYMFSPLTLKAFADLGSVITITGTYVMPSTPSGSDTIIVVDNTGSGFSGTGTTDTLGTDKIKGAVGGPNIDGAGGSGSDGSGNDNGGGGSGSSGSGNSGDGGLVNQDAGSDSSGGCGGSSIMGTADAGPTNRATTALAGLLPCATFFISFLGLVPIAWKRSAKK